MTNLDLMFIIKDNDLSFSDNFNEISLSLNYRLAAKSFYSSLGYIFEWSIPCNRVYTLL